MKVKFVPQNVEFEIKPGQSVMHVAQDNGLYVKSVCKGVPSCAECRVRVIDGDYNVLPPGTEELSLIGTGHFIDHRRLSCQLKCFGDITVDMTEQTQKQAGLIGGRKSKQKTIKDDRVEDAVTIRLNDDQKRSPGRDEGRDESGSDRSSERPRVAKTPGPGPRPARAPNDNAKDKPRPPKQSAPRPQHPNNDVKEQRSPDPTAPGYSDIDSAADPNRPRRRRRRGGKGNRPEGSGGAPGPGSGPSAGPSSPGPRPKS